MSCLTYIVPAGITSPSPIIYSSATLQDLFQSSTLCRHTQSPFTRVPHNWKLTGLPPEAAGCNHLSELSLRKSACMQFFFTERWIRTQVKHCRTIYRLKPPGAHEPSSSYGQVKVIHWNFFDLTSTWQFWALQSRRQNAVMTAYRWNTILSEHARGSPYIAAKSIFSTFGSCQPRFFFFSWWNWG